MKKYFSYLLKEKWPLMFLALAAVSFLFDVSYGDVYGILDGVTLLGCACFCFLFFFGYHYDLGILTRMYAETHWKGTLQKQAREFVKAYNKGVDLSNPTDFFCREIVYQWILHRDPNLCDNINNLLEGIQTALNPGGFKRIRVAFDNVYFPKKIFISVNHIWVSSFSIW